MNFHEIVIDEMLTLLCFSFRFLIMCCWRRLYCDFIEVAMDLESCNRKMFALSSGEYCAPHPNDPHPWLGAKECQTDLYNQRGVTYSFTPVNYSDIVANLGVL